MFREVIEAPIGEVVDLAKEPSLNGFIAWLEKQPADQWFDWCDCHNCAMAQWWKDTGRTHPVAPYFGAFHAIGGSATQVLSKAFIRTLSKGYGTTFGRALVLMKAHRNALPQDVSNGV